MKRQLQSPPHRSSNNSNDGNSSSCFGGWITNLTSDPSKEGAARGQPEHQQGWVPQTPIFHKLVRTITPTARIKKKPVSPVSDSNEADHEGVSMDPRITEPASQLIAREMNNLTIRERERVFEDVHGVSEIAKETPEMLQSNLDSMELELTLIPNKSAYELAQQKDINYVQDRVLRLKFLRATHFDPKDAAMRMNRWFELKLELFGPDKLCKDITLEDLSPDALKATKSGRAQLLPRRDVAGRAVLSDMMKCHSEQSISALGMVQMIFYMFMVCIEDVETQRSGLVCVHYAHNWKVKLTKPFLDYIWKTAQMTDVMPLRLQGFHFLTSAEPPVQKLMNVIQLGISKSTRHRFRMHFGVTQTESLYSLMSYGIPISLLPITDRGGLRTSTHLKWLELRKKKEAIVSSALQKMSDTSSVETRAMSPTTIASSRSSADSFKEDSEDLGLTDLIIDLPSRYDVLLGRGRPFQEHSGNKHLKDLIVKFYDRYEAASKTQKTTVAEDLLNMIKSKGGNFLKKNPDGFWIKVGFSEARAKVAHGFRKKREMDGAKATVPTKAVQTTESKRLKV